MTARVVTQTVHMVALDSTQLHPWVLDFRSNPLPVKSNPFVLCAVLCGCVIKTRFHRVLRPVSQLGLVMFLLLQVVVLLSSLLLQVSPSSCSHVLSHLL